MRKLLLLLALASLLGTLHAQKLKQGINGQVFWLSGNQMPGPGKEKSPEQGIVREIHVYQATTTKDVTQQDGFFTNIQTPLVAKATSGPDGSFKIKLPPGTYSVFIKEANGLFANLYDEKGCINCVSVKPKKYTWMTVTVDYEAAY